MGFNVDNLVIDRALSGTMRDRSTEDIIFYLNQIKEPSLECAGEQVFVTDAVGVKIATFDRSKEAKLTGSNALVNMGLAAAQFGSDKVVASDTQKIITPVKDVLTAKDGKITLSKTPATAFPLTTIYTMTVDGGPDQKFKVGTAASETEFSIVDNEITLPTDTADGTKFLVVYKAETTTGIKIENNAECFAKGGEFILEVLFADICDTNIKYHGYVVFNNAKMSNEVTIDINNEASHGFTIEAMQDYCDTNKKLFEIVVSQ